MGPTEGRGVQSSKRRKALAFDRKRSGEKEQMCRCKCIRRLGKVKEAVPFFVVLILLVKEKQDSFRVEGAKLGSGGSLRSMENQAQK